MNTYKLPWPPTINTYWRSVVVGGRVRVLLSRAGREYKKAVARESSMFVDCMMSSSDRRLVVAIILHPPDRRPWDIDNRVKPVLDSLNGIAWADDSQIDELSVIRGCVWGGRGHAIVFVESTKQGE